MVGWISNEWKTKCLHSCGSFSYCKCFRSFEFTSSRIRWWLSKREFTACMMRVWSFPKNSMQNWDIFSRHRALCAISGRCIWGTHTFWRQFSVTAPDRQYYLRSVFFHKLFGIIYCVIAWNTVRGCAQIVFVRTLHTVEGIKQWEKSTYMESHFLSRCLSNVTSHSAILRMHDLWYMFWPKYHEHLLQIETFLNHSHVCLQ